MYVIRNMTKFYDDFINIDRVMTFYFLPLQIVKDGRHHEEMYGGSHGTRGSCMTLIC